MIAAFGALLSRDNTAHALNAQNKKIGEIHIIEAALSDAVHFVQTSRDLLIADGDSPQTDMNKAQELVVEIEASRQRPVLVASGSPGSSHVLARIADRGLRTRLAARARELGFDVRSAIRPPTSRHRHGGRSVLLHPRDPLDALVALSSTTPPRPRLSKRILHLMQAGDPEGRLYPRRNRGPGPNTSSMAAAYVLGCVNKGRSFDTIYAGLMDPANATGVKIRAIRQEEVRRRRVLRLFETACERFRTSPPRGSRPEVDELLGRALLALDCCSERWHGTRGSALYVCALVLVNIARSAGDLVVRPGYRRLAEALGINWRTVQSYYRDLRDLRVVTCIGPSGGWEPAAWRLVADACRPRPRGTYLPTQNDALVDISLETPSDISPPLRGGCGRDVHTYAQCIAIPPCLTDWVAPDVFGPNAWFGQHGLGFQAWHALIVVERADGEHVPTEVLTRRLGVPAPQVITGLLETGLAEEVAGGYRRGPATLTEAARALRTLGSRTLKRALHDYDRSRYRERQPEQSSPRVVSGGLG